ncbi:hypothetical protein OP10G_4297 [Fimbriimonas ginsengisoli Gsoil 348]|uniref:Uncharacterized protein n=2 Tax=Fimbriimonas ginsengisoli TaxID=1005039 RepID=A0A068NXY0_FIMGI|nr:hypothetical protein OP10G_4297 [Fimbriimonas ginsengisoli Gsoil 348]
MLGGAHSDGLYPIGSASERFVIFLGEQNAGGTLMYQRRHGSRAKIDWHVNLVPSKRRRAVGGTIPRYLQRQGLRISPHAKLTAGQRRKLSEIGAFAAYGSHPMEGEFEWVVRPDGASTPVRRNRTNSKFLVTPEERALLKS